MLGILSQEIQIRLVFSLFHSIGRSAMKQRGDWEAFIAPNDFLGASPLLRSGITSSGLTDSGVYQVNVPRTTVQLLFPVAI